MNRNYCIIGTGVTAVNAAKAIRDHDKEAKILLFGSEKSLPYNRIKLSKELFSELSNEKVLLKKEKWYQDHHIQVLPNTRVEKINTDDHAIITSTGEIVCYDKLLICTGAKNRRLPIQGANIKGVYTIREMQEAEEFKAFIKDKTSIVTIGGGIQGLETAWSLHQAGKKVIIAEAVPRLMARQLDEKSSSILKRKIEQAGIDIYLNTSIKEITGENQVEGIIVGEQTIPCDSVIYSIGVLPTIDLVQNTPIHTNKGIIVNEKMETNVHDVYAAGDVTELLGEVNGLWNRAMDQGKIAGINMADGSEVYQGTLPFTVFNAFNLAVFSIGTIDESSCDASISEEDEDGKYTRLFIKNDTIVGVISHEGVMAALKYKTAIENKASLAGVDLDNIAIKDLMNEVTGRLTVSA